MLVPSPTMRSLCCEVAGRAGSAGQCGSGTDAGRFDRKLNPARWLSVEESPALVSSGLYWPGPGTSGWAGKEVRSVFSLFFGR